MATMKAWQYSGVHGGLEKNLVLKDDVPRLGPPGDQELLVEVISASINPADYKVPELGLIAKAIISTPATPGADFCGRVAAAGSKVDSFSIGETVVGRLEPTQHGTLGELIVVRAETCVSLPAGVDPDQGACLGTAALTAYQSIVSNVKAGDKVFINGGSGGTGTFAIQIAKTLGCHVTASCSGAKATLCKELGADEIIDYTTVDVSQKLKEGGQVFSLAVDFVAKPPDLYKASDDYLLPEGKFVQVGGGMSVADFKTTLPRLFLPGFLGGGHRKFEFFIVKNKRDDLGLLVKWLGEGKLKAVIDEEFDFEHVPQAFEKLKKGKATGKIVVHVAKK
ncbi:GroES-like protein [Pleurostoma richardsiae]|uniref:GroES-like protein n=1 Tax=Pleurostoma richardsiae TaxID=41990 RepID=A0AA38RSM7_9PEZI|nr:GroES-like protein [Pleurostoma richardsiae]